MANQEQEEFGTEEELFYSAFDGDASPAEPEIESEQKPTRERDEHGRFAAKPEPQEQPVAAEPPKQVEAPVEAAAQNEPAVETPPAKEEDDAKIPSWRMREIREARDAERARREEAERRAQAIEAQFAQAQQALAQMQRQIQQFQNPPKQPDPIDLFGDNGPEQLIHNVRQEIAEARRYAAIEGNRNYFVQGCATASHIYPEFNEALNAFWKAADEDKARRGTEAFRNEIIGSPEQLNPAFVSNILNWYRKEKVLSEVGTDPLAYRQKVREELLKDPEVRAQIIAEQRAQAGGQPAPSGQPSPRPNTVTQLPPSLRSVTGTAASADGAGTQHLSEEELFYSNLRR